MSDPIPDGTVLEPRRMTAMVRQAVASHPDDDVRDELFALLDDGARIAVELLDDGRVLLGVQMSDEPDDSVLVANCSWRALTPDADASDFAVSFAWDDWPA